MVLSSLNRIFAVENLYTMRKIVHYIILLTLVLSACTSPDHEAMRQRLKYVSDCNRADTVFTERWLPTVDSLVTYFDHHGSANDRMMAHYVQGRVYHDMGEAPQALECYQRAAEVADTTSSDCDWNSLFRVYGQMADIYDAQSMPQKEIEATKRYLEYATKAGDTLNYLRGIELLVGAYYLLDDTANVYRLTSQVSHLYKKYGYYQEAASVYPTAIYLYLIQGQYKKARELMDTFETYSGLFENGEIISGREHYYNSKGIYYEGVHKLDSAEYYYRKLLQFGYDYEGAKGLLSIYRSKLNADSVGKYSQLEEQALERFLQSQQSNTIYQMNALYDYTNVQRKASEEALKSQIRKYVIYVLLFSILSILVLAFSRYRTYRKEKELELEMLEREYLAAKETIEKKEKEIAIIKAGTSEKLIMEREEEIEDLRKKIIAYEMQQRHQHIGESCASMMDTEIVKIFQSMKVGRLRTPLPSTTDWMRLTVEFKRKMPIFYSTIIKDGCLSKMELRVCMLTRLGFSNGEIAIIMDMSPQSISNAKANANGKLFSENKAKTLFANLEAI